jgi:DedD protein
LILVALGVVFWPIIFVEPGQRSSDDLARIPPRPTVSTAAIEPPDMAGLRPSKALEKTDQGRPEEDDIVDPVPAAEPATPQPAQPGPAVSQPPPAEKKTRSEPPVKPELDAEGIPITWILRVASVSSAQKSEALRKELLAMGHKAYVKKVKSGGRTLYRVYVGPKVEKARLQSIRAEIDAQFGVTSMITRYYP